MTFHVVQFVVTRPRLIPVDVRATLGALCGWHHQDGTMVSDRLVVPGSAPATTIAKILEDGGVPFERRDRSDEYDIYVTTAPRDYDYPYTLEVSRDGRERTVAVPRRTAQDFQVPRYESGFHAVRRAV